MITPLMMHTNYRRKGSCIELGSLTSQNLKEVTLAEQINDYKTQTKFLRRVSLILFI